MRGSRDVLIRVFELRFVAGACCEEGPRDCAEAREDQYNSSIGDGLGAGGGGVAIDGSVGGKGARIDPVEACASGGVDAA